MAANNGEPTIVGAEVHTAITFNCQDGDGAVEGILVDKQSGHVGHLAVRVFTAGHTITVFDTENLAHLMPGITNPLRCSAVRDALKDVLPLVHYTDGKPVFDASSE